MISTAPVPGIFLPCQFRLRRSYWPRSKVLATANRKMGVNGEFLVISEIEFSCQIITLDYIVHIYTNTMLYVQ